LLGGSLVKYSSDEEDDHDDSCCDLTIDAKDRMLLTAAEQLSLSVPTPPTGGGRDSETDGEEDVISNLAQAVGQRRFIDDKAAEEEEGSGEELWIDDSSRSDDGVGDGSTQQTVGVVDDDDDDDDSWLVNDSEDSPCSHDCADEHGIVHSWETDEANLIAINDDDDDDDDDDDNNIINNNSPDDDACHIPNNRFLSSPFDVDSPPPLARTPKHIKKTTTTPGRRIKTTPASSKHTANRRLSQTPGRCYQRGKSHLLASSFATFNTNVFEGKLPLDMPVVWNKRLRTSGGQCKMSRYCGEPHVGGKCGYAARIELSDKILDTERKLRETLLHEMCHAASWTISNVNDGHGPLFRYWTERCRSIYPQYEYGRCHSYDVKATAKYRYRCSSVQCANHDNENKFIKRHSKSLDIKRVVCRRCGSRFELMPLLKADGTPAKPRKANAYSLFVKEHYAVVQSKMLDPTPQEVMKQISIMWKGTKVVVAQQEGTRLGHQEVVGVVEAASDLGGCERPIVL
jgi:predicted SprT family Zn-dependent metalloprotease